jgi:hypothetical protein
LPVTKQGTDKPPSTPTAERAARERQKRQAEALRANLLRRKSQARERAAPPPEKKP